MVSLRYFILVFFVFISDISFSKVEKNECEGLGVFNHLSADYLGILMDRSVTLSEIIGYTFGLRYRSEQDVASIKEVLLDVWRYKNGKSKCVFSEENITPSVFIGVAEQLSRIDKKNYLHYFDYVVSNVESPYMNIKVLALDSLGWFRSDESARLLYEVMINSKVPAAIQSGISLYHLELYQPEIAEKRYLDKALDILNQKGQANDIYVVLEVNEYIDSIKGVEFSGVNKRE